MATGGAIFARKRIYTSNIFALKRKQFFIQNRPLKIIQPMAKYLTYLVKIACTFGLLSKNVGRLFETTIDKRASNPDLSNQVTYWQCEQIW